MKIRYVVQWGLEEDGVWKYGVSRRFGSMEEAKDFELQDIFRSVRLGPRDKCNVQTLVDRGEPVVIDGKSWSIISLNPGERIHGTYRFDLLETVRTDVYIIAKSRKSAEREFASIRAMWREQLDKALGETPCGWERIRYGEPIICQAGVADMMQKVKKGKKGERP